MLARRTARAGDVAVREIDDLKPHPGLSGLTLTSIPRGDTEGKA